MRRNLIGLSVLTLLSGCAGGPVELEPLPQVRIISLVAPAAIAAGQPGHFTANFVDGRAPYQISYIFSGGVTEPGEVTATALSGTSLHRAEVTFVGSGAGQLTVTVADATGASDTETIAFTVP